MKGKNIQSFKEFNENLNISDVNDSEKSKKEWWDKNYQKLIDLDIPYEDWKIIIKHKSDFDGVYNSTAKHRALYLLNTYSIEELENLINDYSFDDELSNMEEYTFLEVNFRNIEGDDRWTIVKVPMNWDESEIRNSMMNDREISEIYNMFETGCSDDNYSWDFT